MCNKAVYANDPHIPLDGHKYHKACAKCTDCGCNITLSNFTKCDTVLYCKTHYFKKFHEEGSYVGGDKYENKNPRDTKGGGVAIPTPVISSTSTSAPAATTTESVSPSVSVSKLTSTLNDSKMSTETVKPSSIGGRKKVFSIPAGLLCSLFTTNICIFM